MPTRCIVAVRAFGVLLALLVGIQALLPQLHCATVHLHPRPVADARHHVTVPVSGGGGTAEDACSLCHLLLATGSLVAPDPAPATAPIPTPLAVRRPVVLPLRAEARPAILWSSPRGPPTA